MKITFVFLCLAGFISLNAQLNETFQDGNFTITPVWTGHASDWQVVASSDVAAGAPNSNPLRLNAASGSGLKYLSTYIQGSWGLSQEWKFWIGRRAQAATGSNAGYLWLWASEADLTSPGIDGYRIRFGDDSGGDELHVEKLVNGSASVFLTSSGAVVNGLTDIGFLVRVTRTAAGLWNLYTSVLPTASGSGALSSDLPSADMTPVFQGAATDTEWNVLDNGYMAIAAGHTTGVAARAGAEFDNISLSFAGAAPLAVRFDHFQAETTSGGVMLTWSNATETDVVRYVIEHAGNTMDFQPLEMLPPKRNDGSGVAYSFHHRLPVQGKNYYRIKAIEAGNIISHTGIILVNTKWKHPVWMIYPNPLTGGSLSISLGDLPPGNYVFNILNSAGQPVRQWKTNHAGGSFSRAFEVNLQKGFYLLQVTGPARHHEKLVVQ
jgi:hypothetical protein